MDRYMLLTFKKQSEYKKEVKSAGTLLNYEDELNAITEKILLILINYNSPLAEMFLKELKEI